MTSLEFKNLYTRELDNLHKEISAYTDESHLWITKGEIKNCAGNLVLHLIGNVNHFIGAQIGKTGYVRNRDAEFSSKNIPKEKLLEDIVAAKTMIEKVFQNTDPEEMQKTSPVDFLGKQTNEYVLCYFLGHFMYHLGQINYLRRLL